MCDWNCELKVSVKQPEIFCVFFLNFQWFKLRVKSVREAAWEFLCFFYFLWFKLWVKIVGEAAWEYLWGFFIFCYLNCAWKVSVKQPEKASPSAPADIRRSSQTFLKLQKVSEKVLVQTRIKEPGTHSVSGVVCRSVAAGDYLHFHLHGETCVATRKRVYLKNQVGPKLQLFFRSSGVLIYLCFSWKLLISGWKTRHLEPCAPPRCGQLSWRLKTR